MLMMRGSCAWLTCIYGCLTFSSSSMLSCRSDVALRRLRRRSPSIAGVAVGNDELEGLSGATWGSSGEKKLAILETTDITLPQEAQAYADQSPPVMPDTRADATGLFSKEKVTLVISKIFSVASKTTSVRCQKTCVPCQCQAIGKLPVFETLPTYGMLSWFKAIFEAAIIRLIFSVSIFRCVQIDTTTGDINH